MVSVAAMLVAMSLPMLGGYVCLGMGHCVETYLELRL